MTSATRRYSLAHPPPTQGDLDGRETSNEAEILEVQALQAEHDGDGGRSIQLMERALQIRCHVVNQLREKWVSAPDAAAAPLATSSVAHRMSTVSVTPMTKEDVQREYQVQCGELYDAAERLVISCNSCGVEQFKKDAFPEATVLLEYAMQLTEEEAYPLCEAEERRRHLRGVTLNNLGCMERRRGHFSEALQYMKASVEMTGVESPVAYMNMSAILIQLRLNDEAVRMAERAIALLAQTPEDPSLLAVAHHNLAMALEPVDPYRCAEEYDLAYRAACATQGKDSSTSLSIQHSWQRFERTRAPTPPPAALYLPPRAGAATNPRQRAFAAGPNTFAPSAPRRTPTPPAGATAATTPTPADAAEIFPHPFLLTASAPRRPHAPGHPAKAAAFPSRLAAARRTQHEATPERALHRPAPPPVPKVSSKAATTALRAMGHSGRSGEGSDYADERGTGGLAPSPPSTQRAAASRRFSPSRAAENSPHRTASSQRRLSEQGSGAKKAKNNSRLSPLKASPTRVTATSTTESAGSLNKPGRVPRRPAERGLASTSSPPPPRVLPPLQTAGAEDAGGASKPAARPSRDAAAAARASVSQHQQPTAAASLDDNPLVFLQNRLDVLLQDEEELEQKYKHANTIQRCYRGHLARKNVGELRAVRARDARLSELRRHQAARQIQRTYRRHRRQRRYPFTAGQSSRYAGGRRGAQHQAAAQLQRIARGWLARRRYAQMRQYARDSPAAASRIQRWYRGVHAERQHAALLAQKAEQEREMQVQEQRQYAATRIQGQWRAYSKHKAYETDLRNRMTARAAEEARQRVESAVRIQSVWRGSQARKLYRNAFSRSSQLRAARQEYEQRRQAAVKLQSFGRMIIAQQQSEPMLTAARLRAAKEINTRSREGRAARIIQCAYRSHVARGIYAERKSARDAAVRASLKQLRAALLQRVGRGFAARRVVGAELAALQDEVQRYERRLRELEQGDAAAHRSAQEMLQQAVSSLKGTEADGRGVLVAAEHKARQALRHHCEIATENVAAEVKEREAKKAAAMPTLDGFARLAKAKLQRARRQSARDAYLDRCGAEEDAAHEDASARTVTAFMRSAGARNAVRSRSSSLQAYNDARAEAEAAESSGSEDAAAERAVPEVRRPLTAQQIAAERAELDRLAAEEGAEGEQPAVVEHSDDVEDVDSASVNEEELMAQQKAVWQAEEKASRQRRLEQEALHRAMFDYKQERIAAAEGERDLLPYTKERVRLQMRSAAEATPSSGQKNCSAAEEAAAQNLHRQQRLAQERGAVHTIERHYTGYKARGHYAALQRVRDEYLTAQQEQEQHEGPVLVNDRLREVLLRHPGMELYQRTHVSNPATPTLSKTAPSLSPPSPPKSSAALDGFARLAKAKLQRARRQSARDAYLERCGAEEDAAHEDASARTVTAFMRSAGARNAVRSRSSSLQAYNDARAEAEAEAAELSGSEDAAAAPAVPEVRRPLTAQQIAAERQQLDHLTERENVESRSQVGSSATDASKGHPEHLRPSLLASGVEKEESSYHSTAPPSPIARDTRRPTVAEAHECLQGFAQGIKDRNELRQRQASRDAYLNQLHDPVEESEEDEETSVSDEVQPTSNAVEKSATFADHDGIRLIYRQEREEYASRILDGFARLAKAKLQRARRQSARDAYLERCGAEEDAAHEDASARTVTAFMRSAGARNAVRSRSSSLQAYNDARAEAEAEAAEFSESEDAAAERAVPEVRRPLAAQQIAAERAELDRLAAEEAADGPKSEEEAVEELLHAAALLIQCVYRGHLARQQAAMAIVRRDLYLLSLQAQEEADAARSSSPLRESDLKDASELDVATPLLNRTDDEVASTAVVMPVDEEAEEALRKRLLQ